MKKLMPKIIKSTPIFFVLMVYLFIPLTTRAQSVQCTAVEEGGTCSSGEYIIRYTGVDEFGNREFNVRKVALGTDERYIDSPFLTDYLAAMYKYAVIATTILVTVVIIFAGVLYITSAGNVEQTGRAKKMIARAITGLVLAVGSYTILWTINPQLVEFGGLKILRIEKKDIDEAFAWGAGNNQINDPYGTSNAVPVKTDPNNLGYGYNNVIYFGQGENSGNNKWGPMTYGRTGCTLSNSGCGPTSFAMVLRTYEKQVDPKIIADFTASNKGQMSSPNCGTAATKEFLDAIAKTYDMTVKKIKHKDALKYLKLGIPLIQSQKHEGFSSTGESRTTKGHYLVYTGTETVDGQLIIRVNDSGRQNVKEGITYKIMDQFNLNTSDLILVAPQSKLDSLNIKMPGLSL